MKKIFLIAALCFMALTEHAGAKAVKLWTAGGDDDGRGLAVRDNDRTICPKGKTKSGSVCVNCDTVLSNCEWCSSTTVCTKCQKGYIVKDGRCKKDGCNTDADCEANQSCDTIAKKCETLDCQRGTYLKDHKCLKCPDECTECKSATVCTACKTNYELEGTECTQIKCSAGQYVEHSACHPCSEAIENCGECSTSKTCTKCENGTVLEYGKCVEPKCRENADCKETEKCNGTTKMCEKVVCDEGYEVGEHTCLPIKGEDPECNENTDCEDDEVCVDGGTETAACVPLECKDPNQRVENHACVTFECSDNEDCGWYQVCDDEHKCVNATKCEELRPASRYKGMSSAGYTGPQYINVVNLSCYIKMDGCSSDNDCRDEEYCNNGQCEGLSCGTYYCSRKNHKCVLCEYTCMTDEDCAKYEVGHRKCINHICDEGTTPGCSSNSDCGVKQTCSNGTCMSLSCQAGQYPNNHVCTSCPAGYYKGSAGSDDCTLCPAGTFGSNTGLTACIKCSSGTYGPKSGGTGIDACPLCPKGYYSSSSGNTSCTACPTGYTTEKEVATSSSDCVKIAGYCSSNNDCTSTQKCQSNSCVSVVCSKGQYVSNHSCVNCAAGYQGSIAGVCAACPAGYYASGTGNTSCTACAAGYQGSATGMSSCSACSKGTYAAGTGNTSCTSCPSGQTTSGTASTSSSACYSTCSQSCTNGNHSTCPRGYMCSNSCCVKCGAGSNLNSNCNCGTNDISTGYGQCQGSSYCFLSCSNIANCNSCSTKTSCGFTSYVCSSCKSGYKVTDSGICVASSSGSCKNFAHYGGCAGAPSVCESDAASDYGKVCTSGSQCAKGRCAPCSTVTNSTQQGSTCR